MTNRNQINISNYEKASKLLSQLIDADSDVAEQINSLIQHKGVVSFFKTLKEYDLSPDILEKLQAVRDVLFGLGIAGERKLRGGGANNA